MDNSTFTSLIFFTIVALFTPGPNNLMLMASGANHGFRKTLPHLLGVATGFAFMFVCVGLGLMQVFAAYPFIYKVLKVVSICYLLYLAYRIATSTTQLDSNSSTTKPLSFIQAALFQWVNPKAWTMALSAITLYTVDQQVSSALFVSAVFFVFCFPSGISWTLMGLFINRIKLSYRQLQVFNYTMAILLIGSIL